MFRWLGFLLMALAIVLNGCDLFQDETCSTPLDEYRLDEREAVLRIEGNGTCRTIEDGYAWFNPEALSPASDPALFMEVSAPGERGLSVLIARKGHRIPETSTHEIADLSNAPRYPGWFEIYEDKFSVVGYEIDGGPAYTTSGTLEITRSESDDLRGTFSVSSVLEENGESIRLSGRFRAFANELPWQSY